MKTKKSLVNPILPLTTPSVPQSLALFSSLSERNLHLKIMTNAIFDIFDFLNFEVA
jgi:hypothetical protein